MPRIDCLFWNAALVALLLLVFNAFGCRVLQPTVARRADGVTSEGRFVEPDAYALYAMAALLEARGQWDEALRLYQRALDIDDRGPELNTRIGAVACKLRRDEVADRAFAAAGRAAADYGPLWLELSQCQKSRADLAGALRAALEAIRLDPEREQASILAADLAELNGNGTLAWQLRDGLSTHAPNSPAVQRSLLAAAERNHDASRAARAQASLRILEARGHAERSSVGVARALEALQRGDITSAKRESARMLGADPSNGDALVIALAVADLEHDHEAFDSLLARATDSGIPASPQVLGTLREMLARRVDAGAALLLDARP